MSNLQVKFLPTVFNFRIGSFAFPQLTDLVWVYTICCCILYAQFPQDINNIKIVLSGSFLLYARRHPKYCNVEESKLSSTLKRSCRWMKQWQLFINKWFHSRCEYGLFACQINYSKMFPLIVQAKLHCIFIYNLFFIQFGYQLSSISILHSLKFFKRAHFIYGNIAVNIKFMY